MKWSVWEAMPSPTARSSLACFLTSKKRSLNITLSAPDDSPAGAWSFDSPACDCSTALSQFCQQLEACRSIAASSAALEKEWAEGLRPESEDLIQGEPQGSRQSFSAPDTELFAWSDLARSGGGPTLCSWERTLMGR